MITPERLAEEVKTVGRKLGFDRVAVGPADPPAHADAFARWLEAGRAGTMAYLERGRQQRSDPGLVLPGARSVVTCALNYHQRSDPGPPGVARYAWGDDYHGVMEPRLQALGAAIVVAVPGAATRAYVDTGPVLERDLAARAGLGWIGKNTMLLHPDLGSFFFIGVVLTTAVIAPDTELPDRCGTCTRCLDACPTRAFTEPYVLDARRCIAYLTIEHRGAMTPELRPGVGTWAFGCDICQDVCPWNRRAPETAEAAFRPRELPSLTELAALDDGAWRERLARSPLRRARRDGLARNAAVALGNAGESGALAALATALFDASPVVRGHAAWALGRIGGPGAIGLLRRAARGEARPDVLAEIDGALAEAVTGDANCEGRAGPAC